MFIIGVHKYVKYSEFENADLSEVEYLLKSKTERLKNDKPHAEYNKPLTANIRDTLKELMQKELEQLSDTLKELEPVQRINILCKLMPFCITKN